MTPHLLYVAWGYPPSRGAGMYRALATANAFVNAGWKVTVLTATQDTFERITGSDPASESVIDPRITVVRVPFDPPRGEADLSRWSRWRIYSPLLWNYLRSWRSRLSFPEPAYGSWKHPLITATKRIHAKQPVSLVIGTANPSVDFAPGDYLHRAHGIPYVVDHRDAWHLNVYSGETVGSAISRSTRMERRLLRNAAEAWFVNEPIRDWHAAHYPPNSENYFVVSNGFDPNFLDRARTRRPDADRGLVFGYLGTIYGPIPLRETLQAWRLARSQSALLARSRLVFRGRIGHFATPEQSIVTLLDEFSGDGVFYDGPVSKTDVSDVYREFDALLLILSRSKYVTSGKVFEYAATGLPIAALHHEETAATSTLNGYPERFEADEVTVEAFARTLIATGERAASIEPEDLAAAQRWSDHLARDQQLAPRITRLRSLMPEVEQ